MSNTPESIQAVATRVRRLTRNADILLLCDHALAIAPPSSDGGRSEVAAAVAKSKFDKTAYQKTYMRKRRAGKRSASDGSPA